ncbi:hypothetical protein C7S18_05795 [Ahniella affigens]|uniref:Delta-60 repeat domain-containing protein n=1 Tax=Ahniella affigens TaxID=2021234 RepID=A0A2P1PPG6_9GAMM|nr:delta-60 repeat domain-containing protein [Ahniella affigens]AVP96740.1 hypothetical protein C7S18_05795 [Ahniella affigens]
MKHDQFRTAKFDFLRATILLIALVLASVASAQNAGINRAFGTNGIASLRDPANGQARYLGLGACATSGNRLNVVTSSSEQLLTIFRLQPDGTSDTSFGTNGLVNTVVPPSSYDEGKVSCMSDGRMLVVRMVPGAGTDTNVQLLRLNANGTLDTSFASTGILTVDFDEHASGLGDLEFPLGLNLEADGSSLVTGRVYRADGSSRPGLVRVDSNGSVAFVRLYDTLTGVTPVYATSANIGPNGRIWMVGGGNPTSTPFNSWFRTELDVATGNVVQTFVGSDGNYIVDGGRVLPNGIMVVAGKYVPQSQPGGAYQPRLVVFRTTGASVVPLPLPSPVSDFEPTLSPYPGRAIAIPTSDNRVLFGAPIGDQSGNFELATYAAIIELGADSSGDRVDTRFGQNGATQFAYRTATPCANGAPPLQRPVRFSNWLNRPVVAGIHATTCALNPRNAFAARLLAPEDVLSNGFE